MDANSGAATDDWNAHWSNYAAAAALNPAQAYRRKVIFEMLNLRSASAPVRLLDVGSGTGDFAAEVLRERADAEVIGLDMSARGIEIARQKVPRARFLRQDFTQPIALDQNYRGWATHAVCSEVLEHLDDPVGVLKNIRALCAPGCRLVLTVPGGPMSAFDKHIGHRRHFTPKLLERTLTDAGLDVAQLRGAGFPFFNVYRLAFVARGTKLIEDAANGLAEDLPLSARLTMRAFSWLFRMNMSNTRFGWQLVAVGSEPR